MTDPTAVAAIGSSIGAAAQSAYTVQLIPGGVLVFIDASASTPAPPGDDPLVSYTFAAGDGSGVAGPQPGAMSSHKYTSPGVYSYSVRVIDSVGATDVAAQIVHILYAGEVVPPVNPEGTAPAHHPYFPLDPDNPSFVLHRPSP